MLNKLKDKKLYKKFKRYNSSLRSIVNRAVNINRYLAIRKDLRPNMRRRYLVACSFVFFVLFPSFVGVLYYSLLASDRYVSGAGFAVRSINANSALDTIGVFTGLASTGSTSSDSYIVTEYLKSRDLLEQLSDNFNFKELYTSKRIDFFSRLSYNASFEELVDYWDKLITVSFNPSTGIINFEVEAFRPDDAKKIAEYVYQAIELLVNKLSDTARKDSLLYAEKELLRAENKLKRVSKDLMVFRKRENLINPNEDAVVQTKIIAEFERKLAEVREKIATMKNNIDEDSPTMVVLKNKEKAIQEQIASKRKYNIKMNKDSKFDLSSLISQYTSLELDSVFAQKAYASALSSLEQARVAANRQQRYLATYSFPLLPDEPLYPRRARNILLLLFALSTIWGIGVLVAYSIRDHMF